MKEYKDNQKNQSPKIKVIHLTARFVVKIKNCWSFGNMFFGLVVLSFICMDLALCPLVLELSLFGFWALGLRLVVFFLGEVNGGVIFLVRSGGSTG